MTNTIPPLPPDAGVTIGIPVYNEELILVENTVRLMAYLDTLQRPYQILIGSNGSTDATVRLGQGLQERHSAVECFHLPRRGVGLAFREFVGRARFPVLVSLDMDLSAALDFVPRAVALCQSHDIVVGSKKLAVQHRSWFRKTGSDVFLWWARRLTGLPYDDYSIGAKAYRVAFLRQATDAIDAGSSYVLDLCAAAHVKGRPIACVPVDCVDHRASRFNLLREAFYKFRRLFELRGRSAIARQLPPERPASRADVAMAKQNG